MSEPQSALSGERAEGYVTVSDGGMLGMILLRGDHGDAAFAAAVRKVLRLAVPAPRRMTATQAGRRIAWMSPDELMVFCDHAAAPALCARLQAALAGQFALAIEMSDARSLIRAEGAALREVLAKLTPADTATAALPLGEVRRTRLAQAAVAFWLVAEDRAEIICFRSLAHYVFALLVNAARPGSEVGYRL